MTPEELRAFVERGDIERVEHWTPEGLPIMTTERLPTREELAEMVREMRDAQLKAAAGMPQEEWEQFEPQLCDLESTVYATACRILAAAAEPPHRDSLYSPDRESRGHIEGEVLDGTGE